MEGFTQVRLLRKGPRATLTFARPEALNALSPTLVSEALAATRLVAASDARVLVVTGEGRSFSAGVDLKAVSQPGYDREAFFAEARALARLFETMPQATIARITGHCFTGGLELALGCDFMVAADEALFCDTHAKLGFRPAWGLSQRLPRRVGQTRAREMSFTARRLSAREAKEIGLILDAVPAAELDKRIDALVEMIVANSAGSIGAYKRLFDAALTLDYEAGLEFEATADLPVADRKERQAAVTGSLGQGRG
ncbi:MAG: enoyl-CoA hydratase/isomerase family protein [Ignavibacteriales bacterium]